MTCAAIGLLVRVSYEVTRDESAVMQAIAERQALQVQP
jgi:hypothetical protein